MGTTAILAARAYRAFAIDGNPLSGPNKPDKTEITAVFVDADQRLVVLEAGQSAGALAVSTWAVLATQAGSTTNGRAEVFNDAGTHTDPVVGGTVPNNGVYGWSISPAGWRRQSGNTAAGLAPLASPALTGTPTAPTAPVGNNSTQLATTGFVAASFALQSDVSALTAAVGTLSTAVATKAAASDVSTLSGALAGVILAPPERPGEMIAGFAAALDGGAPSSLAVFPSSNSVATTEGTGVTISGSGLVAMRKLVAIEPYRSYRARYAVMRLQDAPDPDGDAIRLAVRWYDANKGALTPDTIVEDKAILTVAAGRYEKTGFVGRQPVVGGTLIAPAGARFARAYVKSFGVEPVTAVLAIELKDVTDAADAVARLSDPTTLPELTLRVGAAEQSVAAMAVRVAAIENGISDYPFALPNAVTQQHYGRICKVNQATGGLVTLPKDTPRQTSVGFLIEGTGLPTFQTWAGVAPKNRSGHSGAAGQYALVTVIVMENPDGQSADWYLFGDTA